MLNSKDAVEESASRAIHSHVHGHSEMQALTWQTRSEADAVETSSVRVWTLRRTEGKLIS